MTPRLALLSVCLLLNLLAGPATCHADRVYRLVDHAGFQAGHTIRGTITTTDSAPDDFSLDTAEILDWEWRITGPNSFTANRHQFLTDATLATGVLITPGEIYLAIADSSEPLGHLELARRTDLGGRGFLGHVLRWRTNYSPSQGTFNNYGAQEIRGDAFGSFWSGPLEFGFGPYSTIAIAVPEPSTIALIALTLVVVPRRR